MLARQILKSHPKEFKMKKVVSLVLATGLGLSSLSAVESQTLSQSDKEFLFASK